MIGTGIERETETEVAGKDRWRRLREEQVLMQVAQAAGMGRERQAGGRGVETRQEGSCQSEWL